MAKGRSKQQRRRGGEAGAAGATEKRAAATSKRRPAAKQRDDAAQWSQETFGEAKLGNSARTRRVVTLAGDLARSAGSSPSKASGKGRTRKARVEGAYRALRNQHIHPDAVAEAGFQATAARAAALGTLLAIQDTTSLSYAHSATEHLGDLGGPTKAQTRGLFVHSSLLVEADTGRTVGLIEQEYWAREPGARGKRHERKNRPYEDKESFKWERAAKRERARLGDEVMKRTLGVCDRESDVYEYLEYKQSHNERFVTRASWDRAVALGPEPEREGPHLFEALRQAPRYGTVTVEVPQRSGRPARTAVLTLHATRVRIRRPQHHATTLPAHLWVNAVLAREEHPPEDADPLDWLLLTSEPISTKAEVLQVLTYYRRRWRIEEFHKAWKSGAGVERRRNRNRDNLQRIAVLLAFVAVRLLQLRERAEATPTAPCDEFLEPVYWKVLWVAVEERRPPKKVPNLRWAYEAIGQLAGWTDTKRTGRIGWDTFWEGWHELEKQVVGYRTALLVGED